MDGSIPPEDMPAMIKIQYVTIEMLAPAIAELDIDA
jgi:hypothetical protein